MRKFRLSARANRDLVSARSWYEQHGDELADQFLDEVLEAIQIACERPMSCPSVDGDARALRCRRFPYRVYFVVLANEIDVLAVYHTAREPGSWKSLERE